MIPSKPIAIISGNISGLERPVQIKARLPKAWKRCTVSTVAGVGTLESPTNVPSTSKKAIFVMFYFPFLEVKILA
jgi:hypothetical protein